MADYRIISADSHFVEPPNMWAERRGYPISMWKMDFAQDRRSLEIGGHVKSVMYSGLQLAGAPRDLAASAAVTVMIGDLEA
jgi:hypothetical protein